MTPLLGLLLVPALAAQGIDRGGLSDRLRADGQVLSLAAPRPPG